MNILFFTHNLNRGGAEKTVRVLSAYFNAHYKEITSYICVVYDDPDLADYPENVIVMRHRSNPSDSKLRKGLNVLAQIREMKDIKRRYKIDVCVSFLSGADIINVLSGVGERQIVSVRSTESMYIRNIFMKWYHQIAYRMCDHIVAMSTIIKRDCISYFGVNSDKISTIHLAATPLYSNGIIMDEYRDFVQNHFVFISVGRMVPAKAQVHLLRAFADLVQRLGDASPMQVPGLAFVGDGPLCNDLQRFSSELGINDHILFCGWQSNAADYLRRADAFIMSSSVEGGPNALVEALQCGVPSISTECGAAREFLAPNTDPIDDVTRGVDIAEFGILIPTCGDVNEDFNKAANRCGLTREEQIMSDAMERAYSDSLLRQQYHERSEDAVARLSLDNICQQWVRVIENVVNQQ